MLVKIKTILKEGQGDWWNEMSQEEQEEINGGLAQAETGEFTASEKVLKRFDKWR